jgi:uncharacterized membrane protein
MNKILSVVAVLVLLSAASCQKSELKDMTVDTDSPILIKQAAVASVNGPTTATVNQEVLFNVSWPYAGNCQTFNSFKANTLSDTTHVKLFTATDTAQNCDGKEVQRSSVFKFKPSKKGTYYLKFFGPDSLAKPIIDTLLVK